MATIEKKISVDGSFKLKIGETEISLSREAEALYNELFKALRGKAINWQYIPITPYVTPWWEYKPYETTYKVTCSATSDKS
jgi:hypothetical protein